MDFATVGLGDFAVTVLHCNTYCVNRRLTLRIVYAKGVGCVYNGRSFVRPEPAWANWIKPPVADVMEEPVLDKQALGRNEEQASVFHIKEHETAEEFSLPNPAAGSYEDFGRTVQEETLERQTDLKRPLSRGGGPELLYIVLILLLFLLLFAGTL